MYKKILKPILMISVALGLFLVKSNQEVMASELNFAVTPVQSKFQADKNKTYFDLKLAPGSKEAIEVTLINQTAEEVVVETTFNRATTNINGIAEYGEGTFKEDDSLVYDLEDYIKITEPEVTLKPNEQKNLKIEVASPAEDYTGVMAGGLTFKEKKKQDDDDELKGFAIKNEYAYVVGLLMHGNKDQSELESEILMNNVTAGQVNYRNVISANLQNTQAKYINKMSTKATITKVGASEVLYEDEKTNLQMAPNSNFDYPIALDGKKMTAGKYLLKMSVESDSGNWEFEKEFSISADEARKYNREDVTLEKDNTWLYVSLIIGAVVLIGIIIFVVMYRKQKKLAQEMAAMSQERKTKGSKRKK